MPTLQAFAGIVTVSVGHCHPKVVAAVDRQNHLLQHTTNIYLNNEIAEYAKELTSTLPESLNVSYACLAGTESDLFPTCSATHRAASEVWHYLLICCWNFARSVMAAYFLGFCK